MKVFNKDEQGGGQVLDLDLGEVESTVVVNAPAGGGDTTKTSSFDYSQFRDFDPEINETNFSERTKSAYQRNKELEARNADLEIAAASIYDIDSDENIVRNRSLLSKSNDELVFNSFAYQYEQFDGLSKEDAATKANEKIKDLKEGNKYAIEDEARKIRANIKTYTDQEIGKKRTAITEAREKVKNASKVDPDLKKNTLAEFDKLDEVFGFKLDKTNASFAEKFEKPVRQFIESGDFDKAMADPKSRLEFAVFLKQRGLIEKNLRQPKKPAATLPAKQIPTGGPTAGAVQTGSGELKKYPRGEGPIRK